MNNRSRIWTELGIPADYAASRGFDFQPEAGALVSIGLDNQNRDCRLAPGAAKGRCAMRDAARADGITLLPVSGFRSVVRQAEIIRQKLASGLGLEDILRANAAPGCSEHHTGCAVDVADGIAPPLSGSFEQTAAFDWLSRNAHRFGFHLSYPRGNPHGIVCEPWHWRWREPKPAAGLTPP